MNKTAAPTVVNKHSNSQSKVSLPMNGLSNYDLKRDQAHTPMEPTSIIQRGMIELEEDSQGAEATPEDSIEINQMQIVPANKSGGDLKRKRSTVFGRLKVSKDMGTTKRTQNVTQPSAAGIEDEILPTNESFKINLEPQVYNRDVMTVDGHNYRQSEASHLQAHNVITEEQGTPEQRTEPMTSLPIRDTHLNNRSDLAQYTNKGVG